MSWEDFLNMDAQEVTNAVMFSGMPKEAVDAIWVQKHNPFEVFGTE